MLHMVFTRLEKHSSVRVEVIVGKACLTALAGAARAVESSCDQTRLESGA